jgi:hypothetical protein
MPTTNVTSSSDVLTTGWIVGSGSETHMYQVLALSSGSGNGSDFIENSAGVSGDTLEMGSTFSTTGIASISSATCTVHWSDGGKSGTSDFQVTLRESGHGSILAQSAITTTTSTSEISSAGVTLTFQTAGNTLSNWPNFEIDLNTGGGGGDNTNGHFYGLFITVTYTTSSSLSVNVSDSTTTANTPTMMVDENPNVSDSTTTAESVTVQWYQPQTVNPASDITTTGWSCSSGTSFYTILDQTSFGSNYVYNSAGVSTDLLWLGATFNSSIMSSVLSVNYTVLWKNVDATKSADFNLFLYDSTQTTKLADTFVQIAASSGNTTSTGTFGHDLGFSTVSNWNNFTFQLRTGGVGGDTISNAQFLGIAVTINFIPSLLLAPSESVTCTDTPTPLLLSFISTSDSVTTGDSLLRIMEDLDPSASDSVTTSDSATLVLSTPQISVSDSVTTSDSELVVEAEGLRVSETVVTSDSVQLQLLCFISAQESTTTSDSVSSSERDLPPLQLEDDITTSDTLNVEMDCMISVAEASLTFDFLGMQIPDTYISVSDGTVTSDSTIQVSGIPPFVTAGDFTVTSDSAVVALSNLQISLGDSTTTSDSVGSSLACLIKVTDRTTTSDTFTVTESVPNVEVFGVVDCVPSFKATVTTNPTYTATLMTNPLYVDNANDVTVANFQQSNGAIINNAVFWVSLFDPSGTVVPGANTVQVAYQSGTNGERFSLVGPRQANSTVCHRRAA